MFPPLHTKKRQMEKKLRGIYSAIYSEVNVSVSGCYVLQYAGGTRASSCFISVTLKTWSGWKRLDTSTYLKVGQTDVFKSNSYVITVMLNGATCCQIIGTSPIRLNNICIIFLVCIIKMSWWWLINNVETCSTIKHTVVSTVTTYLSTRIKYPRLPNIHGYQISTVTKYPRLPNIHGYQRQLLWSSWPTGFQWISLLEEYERCL
jgi:hypothetical protein